jgi:hypothetical protein
MEKIHVAILHLLALLKVIHQLFLILNDNTARASEVKDTSLLYVRPFRAITDIHFLLLIITTIFS